MQRWLPLLLLPALLTATLPACMKAERLGTDTNSPDGLVFGSFSLDLLGAAATGYSGAEFVAVGGSEGWYSMDGTNWSPSLSFSLAGFSTARDVAFGDGMWVAVGSGSQGECRSATSSDGMNWSTADCPSGIVSMVHLAYGNGYFWAVGGTDGIACPSMAMVAVSGAGWIKQADIACSMYGSTRSIAFSGNEFHISFTDNAGADRAISATTPVSSLVTTPALDPAYMSYRFFAGFSGEIAALAVPALGNGEPTSLRTMNNGAVWTISQIAILGNYASGIAFGNSVSVAAGGNSTDSCMLMHKTSTIPWTPATLSGCGTQKTDWQAVVFNAKLNKFVAAGTNPGDGWLQFILTQTSGDASSWIYGSALPGPPANLAIASAH